MAASAPVRSFDLGGRVALITGAGRGIGAAIGRAAAAAGAPAVLSARSVPQLEAAARGNGAIVFVGSLTSERLGLPTTAGYAAAKADCWASCAPSRWHWRRTGYGSTRSSRASSPPS